MRLRLRSERDSPLIRHNCIRPEESKDELSLSPSYAFPSYAFNESHLRGNETQSTRPSRLDYPQAVIRLALRHRAESALDRKIVRYVCAGGTLALLSAALITLTVAIFSVPAGIASLMLAPIVAPVTYLTHRFFTFRSGNQVPYELGAFLSVLALNYPISVATIFVLVDLLGLNAFVGGLLAACLLPGLNFVLHSNWVFKSR